jgi:hypothetical protein
MKKTINYPDIFLSKFHKDGDQGCWTWNGCIHKVGNGGRFYNGKTMVLAHAYSYEHFTGPIPSGLTIYQVCRNRLCVNPAHLVAITRTEIIERNLRLRVLSGMGEKLETGCIEWLRARHHQTKYGQVKVGRQMRHVPRVVYELFVGPIPDGLLVCHKCDNPPCCNPDHLFLGTQLDNAQDRDRKGRLNPRHGELNARAKLSESQALKIIDLYRGGSSSDAIAGTFSVSVSTVQSIVSGKTWRHLCSTKESEGA